jgi:hypothetical protein
MEKLLMTTFSREDFKEIIKECLKEEIGKIKVLPESQNYPVTNLTVKDLTILFNVSKVTIRNWTLNGTLKVYRAGNKRVYYKKDEVESVLKAVDVPLSQKQKFERAQKEMESGTWLKIKELENKTGIPFKENQGFEAERLRSDLASERRMRRLYGHD